MPAERGGLGSSLRAKRSDAMSEAMSTPRLRHTAIAAVATALMLPAVSAAGEPALQSAKVPTPTARPTAASPAGSASCRPAQFRIVVDVGHTAESPGAMSARGVPEYEFNLSLSWRIQQALVAAGFTRAARLISNGPARDSLYRRVAHANRLRGDLFLSVHHDSVPDKFLQFWQHDGRELGFSDRFRGHSLFVSHASPRYAASLTFARLLGRELKARGLVYTPHYTRRDMGSRRRQLVDAGAGVYRFDRLFVLRKTNMPAVLLEAASIINRNEEPLGFDPRRQGLVAAAVVDAVEAFCAERAARTVRKVERAKRKRPARAATPPAGEAMPTEAEQLP